MSPGPQGKIINEYGKLEKPPQDWDFVPAGNAALTRKITAKGTCWRIQIKKGKRLQSQGIWAPNSYIEAAKKEVEAMLASPDYEKKKATAAKARNKKQEAYAIDFELAVAQYLNFHSMYQVLAQTMARLVTTHAIPVGSGTVARTQLIPLQDRASKAVIAWMRHATTKYDNMKIARIKGQRRAVRKQLAIDSIDVLKTYQAGAPVEPTCPLYKILSNNEVSN